MIFALLGTVFIASLIGSLHCVGMCGPFALVAGSNAKNRSAAVAPTVAYSFGRLISYSMVGFVFGTLGLAFNSTFSFSYWQQTATLFAGVLMILVGLIAVLRYSGWSIDFPSIAFPLQKILQAGFRKTVALPPLTRATVIGLLTSLMPCGWLYAFGISAAGTGSPWLGMLLMMAFWAGTVPIMAALMLGFSHFGNRLQHQLPLMMASLIILLGVFTIFNRGVVDLSGMALDAASQQVVREVDGSISAENLMRQVSDIDQAELPCCAN